MDATITEAYVNKAASIRLLSIIALCLLVGIGIIGTLLILANPGLVIVYLACAIGLIIGLWLLVTRRQALWWLGLTLAALAPVAGLTAGWMLVSTSKNFTRIILLTLLALAYLIVVASISRLYWSYRRQSTSPRKPRRLRTTLIINPKSGDGRAIKSHIPEQAKYMGIDTHMLQPGDDIVKLARQTVEDGAETLSVSGGDGTLGLVAGVAIEYDVPLVVLPGGTRCHFARDIGLDPARINDAMAAFEGVERRVDVGTIGDRIFLNNASFGLYAEIVSDPDYRDHKIDVTTKALHNLSASNRPYFDLKFLGPGNQNWHHAAEVLVGVNRYETLKLDQLGERKYLDQGVLQVIALSALGQPVIRQLLRRIHISSPNSPLQEWTANQFTVSHPSGQVKVGVDGETLELPSPVHISILPKALRLLVPAEGTRSRPIKPISVTAAKTLWQLIIEGPVAT